MADLPLTQTHSAGTFRSAIPAGHINPTYSLSGGGYWRTGSGLGRGKMSYTPMFLGHVNVYVRSPERSQKWYEDLLGLHT